MKTRKILRIFAICSAATQTLHAVPGNTDLFMEQHCWDCHDDAKPKAGLNLMNMKFDPEDPHSLAAWTRVYDRVLRGEMPPKEKDQPKHADLEAFLQETSSPLLSAWKKIYQEQGRTIGRRLNPVEYEHTLRDLLGTPWLEIKSVIPPDPQVDGFDNVAEGQEVSYVQMAQFLEAAGIAIDRAMLLRPDPKVETVRTWFSERGRYLRKPGKTKKSSAIRRGKSRNGSIFMASPPAPRLRGGSKETLRKPQDITKSVSGAARFTRRRTASLPPQSRARWHGSIPAESAS